MRTIIIYRSILGTSQRYARWLAEELNTDFVNYKKVKNVQLKNCKNVILVGPTYMSKYLLQRFIKDKWNILKDKKVVFVNIGMILVETPIFEEKWREINRQVVKINIPGRIGALNQSNVDRRNIEKVIKAIKK